MSLSKVLTYTRESALTTPGVQPLALQQVCAFAVNGSQRDLSRRTSTGNWLEDRVTWKEELNYKKAMGYL